MNSKYKLDHLKNDYSIRMLNIEDEEIIQHLFESCIDYFEIVEGRHPEKGAALELLKDLPPGWESKDKRVFGCFNEHKALVALIDILADYPVKGEWIIGLLMIDPEKRGQGLGRLLHEFIKDYALINNADKLRIGVVKENTKAYAFWKGLGYDEVKKANMRYGNKDHVVVVMNLLIL